MPTNKKHIIIAFLKWVFILLIVIGIICAIGLFRFIAWPNITNSKGTGFYLFFAVLLWGIWGLYLYLKKERMRHHIISPKINSTSISEYKTKFINSLTLIDLRNPILNNISKEKLLEIQNYIEYSRLNSIIDLSEEVSFIQNYLETFRKDDHYFILSKEIDVKYEELGITNMIFYPIINHFCHDSTHDLEINISINEGRLNMTFTSSEEIPLPKESIIQDIIKYHRLYDEDQIFIQTENKMFTMAVPLIS